MTAALVIVALAIAYLAVGVGLARFLFSGKREAMLEQVDDLRLSGLILAWPLFVLFVAFYAIGALAKRGRKW